MGFNVSIIIPVFNAEKFISKAVVSALIQPEVVEILVINDGSTDNTKSILKEICSRSDKIKIFSHPNNKNKGRSASRNLGIEKATSPFIAFLDADDYYLPNRFGNDAELFEQDNTVDGIYNAIGVHFYRNQKAGEIEQLSLTTLARKIEPNCLFDVLFKGSLGHFSLDGLTVKRLSLAKIGFFNEKLPVSEDTEFIYRMALKLHLVGGILDKPVTMRGVHDNNVFNNSSLYKENQIRTLKALLTWCTKHHNFNPILDLILKQMWIYQYKTDDNLIRHINFWFKYTITNPMLLFTTLSIKYFPLVRLRKKLFPFLYNNS